MATVENGQKTNLFQLFFNFFLIMGLIYFQDCKITLDLRQHFILKRLTLWSDSGQLGHFHTVS